MRSISKKLKEKRKKKFNLENDNYYQIKYNNKFIKNLKTKIKKYNNYGNKNILLSSKIQNYRKHLSKILNEIHNTNYNQKYWGILLDTFLADLVGLIITQIEFLKKKKNENLIFKINENVFFPLNESSEIVSLNLENKKIYYFLIGKIAKSLNYRRFYVKSFKNNIPKNLIKNSNLNNFDKFKFFVFFKFTKLFFLIFKPNLIVADYFSIKKNFFSINILKNYFIPSKFFYFFKCFEINTELRSKLIIPEIDQIDRTFNELNKFFFPSSFLENYSFLKKKINFFIIHSNKFICSITYRVKDILKILAAELKHKKKQLIYVSHAPFENMRKESRSNIYCRKYHDKFYSLGKKHHFPVHNAYHLKEFSINKKTKEIKILIFNTVTRSLSLNKFYYNSIEVHPTLNSNFLFYKKLSRLNKKNTYIKLFPSNDKNFLLSKKIWEKISIKKKNIIFKKKLFDFYHNYEIIILSEFSTAFFETLLTKRPFIFIYGNVLQNLNSQFQQKFLNLKKLNLIFYDFHNAANFLNKNKFQFYYNWENIINDINFINFRKFIVGK